MNDKNKEGNLHVGRANGSEQADLTGEYISLSLPIWGMSCLSCVRKIEAALSGCPGVAEAEVDFVSREAAVRFDPSKINPDGLKAAIEAAGYQVLEREANDLERTESQSGQVSGLLSRPHPYLIGAAAALGVVGFYLGLLTLMSDLNNALQEFKEYGSWIIALAMGLGVQATLFSLFRAWHQGGDMKAAKCSLAASGGMSTTAMAACCAHYLAVFLPALGLPFLSAAAAGLARYQTYFFMIGLLSSMFGIGLMLRMMKRSGMIQVEALVSHLTFWLRPVRR